MSLYETLLDKMNGREYNKYFTCCCPFHDDHSPSLFVYDDGTFRCASCGKHGKLETLSKKLGSHFLPSKVDTMSRVLPQWRAWEREHGDLEGIVDFAHQSLKKFPQFQSYYKRRKCEKFIDKGRLGYIGGWAVLPVFDSHHEIVDIVCRAVKGKAETRYVVKPSKIDSRPLYVPNWACVEQAERVYVVFGIFDAITLELLGLPVVTGITGKSINVEQLNGLHKRFYIVPDKDEEQDAHKLANKLGWRGKVKNISYPDDCKDPDEIRLKYGNEYLRELIGD